MPMTDKDMILDLLALSQRKLSYLEALVQSLGELCEDIFAEETDVLEQHSRKQDEYIAKIDETDRAFTALAAKMERDIAAQPAPAPAQSPAENAALEPVEWRQLQAVLAKQKEALDRIAALQKNGMEQANALAKGYKDKIVHINRKKTAISGYGTESSGQTGFLLDIKEKSGR